VSVKQVNSFSVYLTPKRGNYYAKQKKKLTFFVVWLSAKTDSVVYAILGAGWAWEQVAYNPTKFHVK